MVGLMGFLRNKYGALYLPEIPKDVKNRTYIVTGANVGLGYECAKHLIRMNAGRVILAVRTLAKGEAALSIIRLECSRPSAGEVWELDLSSLDSVEAFSKRVAQLDRLDAVIENAGLVAGSHKILEGGLETSMLVNVVATMLLAFRVLPKLQESARKFGTRPNLVIVSSGAAFDDNVKLTKEHLEGDVLDALSNERDFNVMITYPKSKLLEIYAVRQLCETLPVSALGVTVNVVNPGFCWSQLDRNGSAGLRIMMAIMRAFFARSTEKGSRNLVSAAFAGPASHGTYFSECRVKDEDLPAWITDKEGKHTQERVWFDLLKRLESTGHAVDIQALRMKE